MKTPNTQGIEKTASNGKGASPPKPEKTRCKCTHECCCPNSKFKKDQTKADFDICIVQQKKKVSVPDLQYSKCPCADRKESTKGKKFAKSKTPCSKDQDCSCTLPVNALSLRNKITDLDDALKSHGRGNKRKTKNIQQKSIQISEVYEDPETKQKSIITVTEKSEVKIEIKTFCDDTRKLEKNQKKKKREKSIGDSSKSSSSKKTKPDKQKKEKKSKEKIPKEKKIKEKKPKEKKPKQIKPKKEKQPKVRKEKPPKTKNNVGIFGCFKKKRPVCPASEHGSQKRSAAPLVYQTGSNSCKDGPCLGIKTISKTERVCEGIVNTNTIIFPENFSGNLNHLSDCQTCKGISDQLTHQTQEIDNLRKCVTECLNILKPDGQAIYMMNDMFERADPNYFAVYSQASDRNHKQSTRAYKISEYTYDPEHKVRDWITHGSQRHHHRHRDRDSRSHTHRHHHHTARDHPNQDIAASANKESRTPDKFDAELDDYLRICQQEYQVYKSNEVKVPKERDSKSKSKASKETSKKTKKTKKSRKSKDSDHILATRSVQGPQCNRGEADCQCGPECQHLGIQTSHVSMDASKGTKEERRARREARRKEKAARKEARRKKKKSKSDATSEELSSTTDKSYTATSVSAEKKNVEGLKPNDPKLTKAVGCMGKFIKCFLCRPY